MIIKALETFYHGYRFRSRLEARWAVFFDQLDLNYRYEAEGYFLDGTCYLPDFELPQHHCFIEIKPKQPSSDELEKARLLALGTGKGVYILYGDVWFAEQPLYRHACYYTPPTIYALPQLNQSGESPKQEIQGFLEAKILLQKLDELGIITQADGDIITFSSTFHFDREAFQAQEYLAALQRHFHQLEDLNAELQQEHNAILQAFADPAGQKRVFARQQLTWDFAWAECSACKHIALRNELEEDGEAALLHDGCLQPQPGRYCYNSPRLKAAYEAARRERFST